MSQLDRLLKLFPDEIPKPSEERIKAMRFIDAAVDGTRAELEALLAQLEHLYRPEDAEESEMPQWMPAITPSWSSYLNTPLAPLPANDGREFLDLSFLQGIHEERLGIVRGLFEGDRDVLIEEGGVKTFHRANAKAERQRASGKVVHCPDVTRMRLVVPDLIVVDRVYSDLVSGAMAQGLYPIGLVNHYSLNVGKKYPTPFRGMGMILCGEGESDRDSIATEVQILTARVRAVVDLDHPFNVAQTIPYPDDEARDWLFSLMLKASILDFKDLTNT